MHFAGGVFGSENLQNEIFRFEYRFFGGIIKMITDGGEDFDLFDDSKMLQDEIAFAILNGLPIKSALKLKTQDFLAGKIEGERK